MKSKILLLLISAVCVITAPAYSQANNAKEKLQKNSAKTFVNQSKVTISAAIAQQKKVKNEESLEMFIARAYDHQKHAIELYNQGNYQKALIHSLKARKIAIASLAENRGEIKDELDAKVFYKDFKNPEDKENKDFFKNIAKAMKNKRDPNIGELESELDPNIEVTDSDGKVDIKQLVNVK